MRSRSVPVPTSDYQQPSGGQNHLKTLETDANADQGRDPALPGDRRAGLPCVARPRATRRCGGISSTRPVPLYTVYRLRRRHSLHAGAAPLLRLGQRRHDLERARALADHRHGRAISTMRSRPPTRSRPTSRIRPASSPTSRPRTTSSSRSSRRCTRSRPKPDATLRAQLDPHERGRRALGAHRRRLLRPLLRRAAAADDRHRLADERRARARDRRCGARPGGNRAARKRLGGRTEGLALARPDAARSTSRGSGDRAPRDPRRGLLRGRARARLRRRPRDVRRHRDLAEQVELGQADPGHGALRLALAHARPPHDQLRAPASRTARRAGRSCTSAPT